MPNCFTSHFSVHLVKLLHFPSSTPLKVFHVTFFGFPNIAINLFHSSLDYSMVVFRIFQSLLSLSPRVLKSSAVVTSTYSGASGSNETNQTVVQTHAHTEAHMKVFIGRSQLQIPRFQEVPDIHATDSLFYYIKCRFWLTIMDKVQC